LVNGVHDDVTVVYHDSIKTEEIEDMFKTCLQQGKVFTVRELETVDQFFSDGAKASANPKVILDDELSEKTEQLIINNLTKEFKKGNIHIDCHFSGNGGTFRFTKLTEVEKEVSVDLYEQDSQYLDSDGKEIGFLIEPHDYGNVEPYNRQEPYYFNGYASLDKIEGNTFNLFLIKKTDFSGGSCKRWNKYHYNNYWKMNNFDMLIEEPKLPIFLTEFLTLYGMSDLLPKILEYLKEEK
jgi:hypothetical protein